MIRERIDAPQFTRQNGSINTAALVQDISEDLGHEEWVADSEHWIWDLAERAAEHAYTQNTG